MREKRLETAPVVSTVTCAAELWEMNELSDWSDWIAEASIEFDAIDAALAWE